MVYGSKLVTANFLESIPAGVKKLNRKLEKKKEERDVTKSHEELVEMKETLAIFQETIKQIVVEHKETFKTCSQNKRNPHADYKNVI